MRGFMHPADFNDKQNMSAQLFQALKEEEDVARQRDPITTQTFATMAKRATTAHRDSPEVVVTPAAARGAVRDARARGHLSSA